MRTTLVWLPVLLAACAETQPLPGDEDQDDVTEIDARAQSRADGRVAPDARPPAPDAGPGGSDGCGSLTEGGRCDGETLHWCSSGEERSLDCTTAGKQCECDGTFCDCKDGTTSGGGGGGGGTTGCGSVTFDGQCNGNTLRYCENNTLYTVDCGSMFMFCDCPPFDICDCWQ